jgi:hypothetical protein
VLDSERNIDELMDLIKVHAPRRKPVSYVRVISISIRGKVIFEFLVCEHLFHITLKSGRDFASV